jgi:UDPglucose 6-dehydrogenase
MRKISVIGCGYVGLVCGAGLAEFGNEVVCIDINKDKIEKLKRMVVPIVEPGLPELIESNYSKSRLSFTSDIKEGLEGCDAIIIAVQTPQAADGSADLGFFMAAARDIAECLEHPAAVVIKSTVPIGTAGKTAKLINDSLAKRKMGFAIEVVSNPEFLREGCAVNTFLEPDRIVVGCNGKSYGLMNDIYSKPVSNGVPMVECSNETAETIKYAANAFLAMKISYINQMARLCEITGADIKTVAEAVGSDERISPKFLNPGPGYGGSCFPKDTRALVKMAKDHGLDLTMIRSAYEANAAHKEALALKIIGIMKKNQANTLAVWGLSFKAGSGDMRMAPALTILPAVAKSGIIIKAYDPAALDEAKEVFKEYENIKFCQTKDAALDNAEALLILTEWDCFKETRLSEIAAGLSKSILLDFRNIYEPDAAKDMGFMYYGVGR